MKMKQPRSVVQKLIRLTFASYLGITLVLTAIQMAVSWRQEQDNLARELALLTQAYRNSLEKAVWDLNQPQIDALLSGMLSLPSIAGVSLTYAGHEKRLGHIERFQPRHVQTLFLDLDPPYPIGKLTLYAEPDIILARLRWPYLVLIANALLKTLALWVILSWFGRRLIGEPLHALEDQVSKLNWAEMQWGKEQIDRLAQRLGPVHGDDEVARLVRAFSRMGGRLAESKKALEQLQQNLEHQVTERTRQLEIVNQQLEARNRALEKLSTTDTLTGVANRAKLEQVLENEIQRCDRYDKVFSVILTDVDHFKHINDTYGHQQGDHVLQQLCRVLEIHLRHTDTLGRWGGEEFLIVATETDLTETERLAQRLRKAVEQHDFGLDPPVTASFGVACYQRHDDLVSLFAKVDAALYRAKTGGRNQVRAVSELKGQPQ